MKQGFINCQFCGREISSESTFCPYCGQKVVSLQVIEQEEERTKGLALGNGL